MVAKHLVSRSDPYRLAFFVQLMAKEFEECSGGLFRRAEPSPDEPILNLLDTHPN